VPLIAETGGINAILADSTALPEQLVKDVITSAFDSAGQRCSAARLLFVQQDIADRVEVLLAGAMYQLVIGNPSRITTDVGPVIDAAARDRLIAHRRRLLEAAEGRWWHEAALSPALPDGTWFAPLAAEIPWTAIPEEEVFGPILHVLRFDADELDAVVARVNGLRYGLTVGIHSRLTRRVEELAQRLRVGNVYVNRTIIGAVVGSQPFGGVDRSGTGFKAGGPDYLRRFAWEQTVTTNTAAIGGNASLLSL
jgi:RHH-type proline utilization regulon transcriptional repressor/proline dehydrogenase/delta 1-pyrroline-5-carboxylate dehydrogenase